MLLECVHHSCELCEEPVCVVCACVSVCVTQIKATHLHSPHSCNFPFEIGTLDLLFFYFYVLIFFLIRVMGALETFSTAFKNLSEMIKVFSTYFFFSKTTQGSQQPSVQLCLSLIPHIEFVFHTHAYDIPFFPGTSLHFYYTYQTQELCSHSNEEVLLISYVKPTQKQKSPPHEYI